MRTWKRKQCEPPRSMTSPEEHRPVPKKWCESTGRAGKSIRELDTSIRKRANPQERCASQRKRCLVHKRAGQVHKNAGQVHSKAPQVHKGAGQVHPKPSKAAGGQTKSIIIWASLPQSWKVHWNEGKPIALLAHPLDVGRVHLTFRSSP